MDIEYDQYTNNNESRSPVTNQLESQQCAMSSDSVQKEKGDQWRYTHTLTEALKEHEIPTKGTLQLALEKK